MDITAIKYFDALMPLCGTHQIKLITSVEETRVLQYNVYGHKYQCF